LHDALGRNVTTTTNVGKRIVLPSSYTGGPRYMTQAYQDAMAIVRVLSPPDYFITFTCNPAWPEITQELFPHQTAADRPDLTDRVFHVKLNQLLKDIKTHGIFGTVVGKIHVIEFQNVVFPMFIFYSLCHPSTNLRNQQITTHTSQLKSLTV
jgi:hypothetical protein